MLITTFAPHSLGGMPTEITNKLQTELGGYHSPLAGMYLGQCDFYWLASKPAGEMLSYERRLSITHHAYSRENDHETVVTTVLAIAGFKAPQFRAAFEVRIWTPIKHEDCLNASLELERTVLEDIKRWTSRTAVSRNR